MVDSLEAATSRWGTWVRRFEPEVEVAGVWRWFMGRRDSRACICNVLWRFGAVASLLTSLLQVRNMRLGEQTRALN